MHLCAYKLRSFALSNTESFYWFYSKEFFYFFNSIYYWDIKRGRLSKTRHGTDINEIFSAHYVKDHNTSQFQVPKQHHERYLSNYLNQNDSCPFVFYVPPILAMKDTCDQWPMKDTCDRIAKIKMTFFLSFHFLCPLVFLCTPPKGQNYDFTHMWRQEKHIKLLLLPMIACNGANL